MKKTVLVLLVIVVLVLSFSKYRTTPKPTASKFEIERVEIVNAGELINTALLEAFKEEGAVESKNGVKVIGIIEEYRPGSVRISVRGGGVSAMIQMKPENEEALRQKPDEAVVAHVLRQYAGRALAREFRDRWMKKIKRA